MEGKLQVSTYSVQSAKGERQHQFGFMQLKQAISNQKALGWSLLSLCLVMHAPFPSYIFPSIKCLFKLLISLIRHLVKPLCCWTGWERGRYRKILMTFQRLSKSNIYIFWVCTTSLEIKFTEELEYFHPHLPIDWGHQLYNWVHLFLLLIYLVLSFFLVEHYFDII